MLIIKAGAYFIIASLQCILFPTICKTSLHIHLTLNLFVGNISKLHFTCTLPISATVVSSSILLNNICPTNWHDYFITLSGSNNWGETKSNFMGHRSSASGHCSDIPAPASGGRRKYDYRMVYFTVNIIAIRKKPASRVLLRRTRLGVCVSDVGISSSLIEVRMTSDLFIMPFTTFFVLSAPSSHKNLSLRTRFGLTWKLQTSITITLFSLDTCNLCVFVFKILAKPLKFWGF